VRECKTADAALADALALADAWQREFGELARAIGCLPSSFVGHNQHAIKAAAALRASPQGAVHPAFVPYTESELRDWFPVMCNHCGWRGLSRDCTGGGPIADTGDYNEITCPQCWNNGDGKAVSPREVVVVAGSQQGAVPEGYALVDVSLIDDELMAAAMRDAGIVRALGAPPETIMRAAISGYLLTAQTAGEGKV